MEHIQTIELGSSQASIEFTSIPQDYDDLVLMVSGRGDAAFAAIESLVKFNASTANFTMVQLFGNGETAATSTPSRQFGFFPGSAATSNTFSNTQVYIANYTNSTAKSFSVDSITENNSTTAFQNIQAGLWNDTSAITSIEVSLDTGNFVSGSTFSLYGVTAGGDGTVTTA